MKTEQYKIQAKPIGWTVGDAGPEPVYPLDTPGLERHKRWVWFDGPDVMAPFPPPGYAEMALEFDVEKRAESLCNASGGDWGKKNTRREYWRKKAAEQIAAEIAAIPPLIPPYWQGFATATGLAVVGYVLQAVMS